MQRELKQRVNECTSDEKKHSYNSSDNECQRVHTNWVENQKNVARNNIFAICGLSLGAYECVCQCGVSMHGCESLDKSNSIINSYALWSQTYFVILHSMKRVFKVLTLVAHRHKHTCKIHSLLLSLFLSAKKYNIWDYKNIEYVLAYVGR